MHTLIAIVFIAELIICAALVGFIVRADRRVCALNNALVTAMPGIETALREAYNTVHNLKYTLHSLICLIRKKRRQYAIKVFKTFVLYFILIFCKGKYKRAAAFFQLAILAFDYIDARC
jgi:hypothetical protein